VILMRTRKLQVTSPGPKIGEIGQMPPSCPFVFPLSGNAVFLPELNRRVSLSPWFAAERTAGKGLPPPAFDAPAMILPPCESLDFA